MIHPFDEENLRRMLGGDIPSEVRTECAVRTRMFHRAGESGQMGPLALINVIRSLGYGPPAEDERAPQTDWRSVPQDGTARVEAKYFGNWMPGVFLGFVEHGNLAIRLDSDPVAEGMVRECRRDMVRLVSTDPYASDKLSVNDPPDARAGLLEDSAADTSAPEPEADKQDGEAPGGDVLAGEKVWVDHDDDLLDAEYVRTEGGEIVVKLEGEERRFPSDKVTFVDVEES